jgi:hypothetical protein
MNWKLLVLGVLVLGAVFISGSIAYFSENGKIAETAKMTSFATCTTLGAPTQSLPIYGGVVYERTGPQTYIAVSQYLVYPPAYGYYSPEGSGVIMYNNEVS